ncbi:MAG: selenide water dikinase [Bacillota bacterium]|nr:MAG: selenide water dikinase [Bacillota bacterium]
MPTVIDARVLVGLDTSDDAGVFQISDDVALVQTLDFFSPMTDDPYMFGQIAAANSLSDVYAMGGTPLTALNIVCYATCIEPEVMGEVMRGGADKCLEAGVVVLGGHTVENQDVKYGLSITGTVHPKEIISNAGARATDKLILTKPLGSGIIFTASKAGLADDSHVAFALQQMAMLNRTSAEILKGFGVRGGTDITGFGLLGHCMELARASKVELELWVSEIPLLPGATEYASMGLIPVGAYRNAEHFGVGVEFADSVEERIRDILYDPQTSGGLLFAVPAERVAEALKQLRAAGVDAACVGECKSGSAGPIKVVERKCFAVQHETEL